MQYVAYMRTRIQEISGGEIGTDQTIQKMMSLQRSALESGRIRLFAISLLQNAGPSPSQSDVAETLFAWVRNHIQELPDPLNIETVQEPEATIQIGAGDCDDQALLMATLLNSVGIETRFRVIGTQPGVFVHVFCEALIDGAWEPFDTLVAEGYPDLRNYPHEKIYSQYGKAGSMQGYSNQVTNPTSLQQASMDVTLQMLDGAWADGRLTPDMLPMIIALYEGADNPAYLNPEATKAILTALYRYQAAVEAAGYSTSLRGLGFLNFLWSAAKYVGVDLIWNNVKKIWQNTDVTLPDINVTAPGVSVTPGAATASGAVQGALSSPIVIAIIAGAAVYLITRK